MLLRLLFSTIRLQFSISAMSMHDAARPPITYRVSLSTDSPPIGDLPRQADESDRSGRDKLAPRARYWQAMRGSLHCPGGLIL